MFCGGRKFLNNQRQRTVLPVWLAAAVLLTGLAGLPAWASSFPLGEVQVLGVVKSPQKARALVRLTSQQSEVLLGKGDMINGCTVSDILPGGVELNYQGQAMRLEVTDTTGETSATLVASTDATAEVADIGETPALMPLSGGASYDQSPADKVIQADSYKQAVVAPVKSISVYKPKKVAVNERPRFLKPMKGWVSSGFGNRRRPRTNSGLQGSYFHEGVDIAAPYGTKIYASAAGKVTAFGYNPYRGRYLIIDHGGGWETRYFHLYWRFVKEGAYVEAGQLIGREGNTGRSTGPHLHFEVRKNGQAQDPALFITQLRER